YPVIASLLGVAVADSTRNRTCNSETVPMDPYRFSTQQFCARDQKDAWTEWFQPVFDVHAEGTDKPGFAAEYSIWDFADLSFTRVSAPATRTVRTLANLRRSPVDHWVISYCQRG